MMPDLKLCLEALSAVSGFRVEQTTALSQLTPQDIVNIVALQEFYKGEGYDELVYPSVGTLSLLDTDDEDVGRGPRLKINPQDFFDPQYDYDFTNVTDGDVGFTRGNEQYLRPCGWNRIALRVVGKYDGGEEWLGTGSGAWPVSYHGNGNNNTEEKPADFLGEAAASLNIHETRGVFSTPDIKIAEKYCRKFKSKVDGNTYKVVLQNRINPKMRTACKKKKGWVIYVPHSSDDGKTRAIVQESLRPYGLLLKRL